MGCLYSTFQVNSPDRNHHSLPRCLRGLHTHLDSEGNCILCEQDDLFARSLAEDQEHVSLCVAFTAPHQTKQYLGWDIRRDSNQTELFMWA